MYYLNDKISIGSKTHVWGVILTQVGTAATPFSLSGNKLSLT